MVFQKRHYGLHFLIHVFTSALASPNLVIQPLAKLNTITAYKPGDYIIGGMFPLHTGTKEGGSVCKHFNDVGLAWVEAMMYATEQISNSELLPNITIGYDIRDDCNAIIRATETAFDFISIPGTWPLYPVLPNEECKPSTNLTNYNECLEDNSDETILSERSVVAVVGPATSGQAHLTSSIFSSVLLPQISYAASSAMLSNKNEFPSFFRVNPSDSDQVKAMIDIMVYFKWTYVSLLGSDTSYGRLGISALEYEASKNNIKIAMKKTFTYDTAEETANDVISYIDSNPLVAKSNVLIIFASGYSVYRLLKEFVHLNLSSKTLFASESWAVNRNILRLDSEIIEGTIGLSPYFESTDVFSSYVNKQTLAQVMKRNPWFNEYFENQYNCYKPLNGKAKDHLLTTNNNNKVRFNDFNGRYKQQAVNCLDNIEKNITLGELFNLTVLPYRRVAFVIDAVYVIAHALHKLLCNSDNSSSSSRTCDKKCIQNEDLYRMVKETGFEGLTGFVRFDEYGDAVGSFTILNIQRNKNGELHYRNVGLWNQSSLTLKTDEIVWKGGGSSVVSRCDEECQPGYRVVLGSDKECWTCVPCEAGQFTNSTNMKACLNCTAVYGKGWCNNTNHTDCQPLPLIYLAWTDQFSTVAILTSSILLVLTFVALCLFVKYRNSYIVKGSNREITYVLFVSLFFCFLSPYVYIGQPNKIRCALQPNYLCFVLSSSALVILFKTCRILSIFNARLTTLHNILSEKKKRDRKQIIILIVVEFVICGSMACATYMFQPIATYEYSYRKTVLISCGRNSIHLHGITMFWFGVLTTVSIYKAYKVRNLPENFNEARGISFTVFMLFLVWVVTSVATSVATSVTNMRPAYLCISAQLHALIILFFMILPKLKVILFEPKKNTTEAVRSQTIGYVMRKQSKRKAYESPATISTIVLDE